jgi:hypothetical protein
MLQWLLFIVLLLIGLIVPHTESQTISRGTTSRSNTGLKGGTKCSSFVNDTTLLNPKPSDANRPCYFGQDISQSESRKCTPAYRSGEFNMYQCQCLSEDTVTQRWRSMKTFRLIIGPILLFFSIVPMVSVALRARSISTNCLGRHMSSAFLWGVAALISSSMTGVALFYLITGLMIDTGVYYIGCGQ